MAICTLYEHCCTLAVTIQTGLLYPDNVLMLAALDVPYTRRPPDAPSEPRDPESFWYINDFQVGE